MGIHNFWSIVESSGRNVSIESLRGKRMAVDISIWLNQIVRAARTKTGETVPDAHIYITVFRLCKLLYYGIKPVIVFDGDAPALKKKTLAKRREKAKKAEKEMNKLRVELLATDYIEQLKSNNDDLLKNEERNPSKTSSVEQIEVDKDIIEQNEMELESIYNKQITDNEIVYVDLPYKDEVLHIAVNTPQLLEVPRFLRSRVVNMLKNQLQNRSLRMLEAVAGDAEEVSKMQLRVNHFRTKVMNDVYEILRKEEENDTSHLKSIERNGYEYVYKENENPFDEGFDFSDFDSDMNENEDMSEVFVKPNELEDGFELKRRRMNDEYFASLNDWYHEPIDEKKEEKEKEEGKLMLYTNMTELMDNRDLSIQDYSHSLERIPFSDVHDREEFLNMMTKIKNEVSSSQSSKVISDEDLIKEFEEYCNRMDKQRLKIKRMNEDHQEEENDTLGDLVFEVEEDGHVFVEKEEAIDHVVCIPKTEPPVSISVHTSAPASIVTSSSSATPGHTSTVTATSSATPASSSTPTSTVTSTSSATLASSSTATALSISSPKELSLEAQPVVPEESSDISNDLMIDSVVNSSEQTKNELHTEVATSPQIKDISPADIPALKLEKPDVLSPLVSLQEEASKVFDLSVEQLKEHKQSLLKQYQHFSSQNAFVSENIILDILEILQIFGIPYVFSPGEAEAQCSFLEMMGLVDGVISNDSDVFAFGGKTVFKDFFVDNQYIQEYRMEDLEKEKGLTRERIIEFALLRGCDYCEGVTGVGRIAAIELVSFFPSFNSLRTLPSVIRDENSLDGVWKKFFNQFKDKLKQLEFPDSFVDQNVINAFMFPAVDSSLEPFEWGEYDSKRMAWFLHNHSSVNESRLNNIIKPALKNQKGRQLRITDLLTYTKKSMVVKNKSKRMKSAFSRLCQYSSVSYKHKILN